ncbi:FAD-dependent oxidoreductase [bacterium]|nr:FAD-dependent oxidoreductase [bacterium]
MAGRTLGGDDAMGTHIVILGGGIAGLAAATRLVEQGYQITLIEKKPFLGGRAYSIIDRKTGEAIDNGQHVVMGCYHHTFQLLNRLGVQHGVRVQKTLSIPYKSKTGVQETLHCPPLPGPLHLLAGLWGMKSLSLNDYWAALRFGLNLRKENPAIKGESVEEFCQRLKQTPPLRKYMWDPICISALNETPEQACAELFVPVLQQAFFGSRQDASLGFPTLSFAKLLGESGTQFFQKNNANLLLGDKATRLNGDKKKVNSVTLQSGKTIPCDICVSALHATQLHQLAGDSSLTNSIWVPKLNYSPILSVYLWFETSFTQDEISCLLDGDFEWALFRSNFMQPGEHKSFCVCLLISAARKYQKWKRTDLVQAALNDLHATYPKSQTAKMISSSVFWEPKATFAPNPMIGCKRPGTRSEIPNFYLAGDWTDTGLPATIEGAALSGHLCAEMIERFSQCTK